MQVALFLANYAVAVGSGKYAAILNFDEVGVGEYNKKQPKVEAYGDVGLRDGGTTLARGERVRPRRGAGTMWRGGTAPLRRCRPPR